MSPMKFWVEAPSAQARSFYESEPTARCHLGHPECSVREGGPCLEMPCTCETDGRCLSCVGRLSDGRRVR